MENELDMQRLRDDLVNYYGTAMFSGFPMAVMELSRVEKMSDREIIEFAKENGIDLNKYVL